MSFISRGAFVGAISLTLMSTPLTAAAQYPTKPVTLIVPGPAGSGTDGIGRLLAKEFSEEWGQPVVVENRAGASGMIGTQALLRQPADGYTILLGHVSTHSVVPAVQDPTPYNPVDDFEAIGQVGSTSNILVVPASSEIQSVEDLIELAKSGTTLSYGSPGVGLTQHFAGYTFGKVNDLDMLHVPYKGSGPALIDLLGGRIHMMFVTPPAAYGGVKGGKLRVLGQTSEKRQTAFPDAPTFEELKMPDLTSTSWFGMFAPAGTPKDVVEKINQSLHKALEKEPVREQLAVMVIEPAEPHSPEDFKAFVSRDHERWKKTVEESDIVKGS